MTVEIRLKSRKEKRPILTTKTQVGHLTFFGALFLNPSRLWKFLDCLKSPLFALFSFLFVQCLFFVAVFFYRDRVPILRGQYFVLFTDLLPTTNGGDRQHLQQTVKSLETTMNANHAHQNPKLSSSYKCYRWITVT